MFSCFLSIHSHSHFLNARFSFYRKSVYKKLYFKSVFFLQVDKDEPLRTGGCHDTLAKMLPKFAKLGEFSLDRFGCQVGEPDETKLKEELLGIFSLRGAKYHSKCVSEYNDQKLIRAVKRKEKAKKKATDAACAEAVENKRARRSDSDSGFQLGELNCLFCKQIENSENLCAAGTIHAKSDKVDRNHVDQFIESLRTKALKLNEKHISTAISTGDVTSNEFYYHKSCLKSFNYRYTSALEKETKRPVDARKDFLEKLNF